MCLALCMPSGPINDESIELTKLTLKHMHSLLHVQCLSASADAVVAIEAAPQQVASWNPIERTRVSHTGTTVGKRETR